METGDPANQHVLLQGRRHGRDNGDGLAQERQLSRVVRDIMALFDRGQPKLGHSHRVLDGLVESRDIALGEKGIGILARRQRQHPQRDVLARNAEQLRRAQRGFDPGIVGVEGEHHVLGIPTDHTDMVLGQRGSKRCNDERESGLMGSDDIHISLDHEDQITLLNSLARPVETVQHPALRENRRLRRVEILGLTVADNTPTKADDPLLHIDDGEQEPSAKPVGERPGVVGRRKDQPGLFGVFQMNLLLPKEIGQLAPVVGGIPDLEVLEGRVNETAPLGVRPRRVVTAEAVAKKLERGGIDRVRALLLRLLALRGLAVSAPRCQGDSGALGQPLSRFDKGEIFGFFDELEDIAAHAAGPEAVPASLFRIDIERRRSFRMERTQPFVLAPDPLQGRVAGD